MAVGIQGTGTATGLLALLVDSWGERNTFHSSDLVWIDRAPWVQSEWRNKNKLMYICKLLMSSALAERLLVACSFHYWCCG